MKVYTILYLLKVLTNDGLFIGNRKSVGFGKIKLESKFVKKYYIEEMKIKSKDITNRIISAISKI